MAILIDIRQDEWITEQQVKDEIAPALPGVEIYCKQAGDYAERILMLATVSLFPGVAGALPNLRLVQKLGAGVDSIVNDPDLPRTVRVCRLKPDAPAHEIAEYCLAYVLRDQRHLEQHKQDQSQAAWRQIAPLKSSETTVAVLGLGHIGSRAAHYFVTLGFNVIGWSRTQKQLTGVDCRWGNSHLGGILSEADYVVSILPSTDDTRNLINTEMLAAMKPGAVIINAGRGDLIVEADLLSAIDSGQIRGAVLDVFRQEPLPENHPFWSHPGVTVTPHVSGWHLDGGFDVIAKNYKALVQGGRLINEVDRQLGY